MKPVVGFFSQTRPSTAPMGVFLEKIGWGVTNKTPGQDMLANEIIPNQISLVLN
ncbi:hypothetical protein HanIR_Chr04g0198521 [Helianthus annuus]|nr:hypothetical protein HanIR_Chr04g0198521 [Helianthus annuus]